MLDDELLVLRKRIPESLDKRRKLSETDKAEIRNKFDGKFGSKKALAKEYGVTPFTIGRVLEPARFKERTRKSVKKWRLEHKDLAEARFDESWLKHFRRKMELSAQGLI